MINKQLLTRCGMAGVLALTLCLFSTPTQAQEPETVTVALLAETTFAQDAFVDILLDGKVIVFGAGPGGIGNQTTKWLNYADSFPDRFKGQGLRRIRGMVVTQGGAYTTLLREISGFPVPPHGVMKLDSFTIDYYERVKDDSNVIKEDTSQGPLMLLILTGEVR